MAEWLTAEKTMTTDRLTGRRVVRWTSSPAMDRHLYFTSPSVTADGRYIAIVSERTGAPNLFVVRREDGLIRQVSDATALLRSYAYPRGTSRGLSKSSPVLDASANILYWVQDDRLWYGRVGSDWGRGSIAALPAQWVAGYMALSSDGRRVCVPCTDPRTFSIWDLTQRDQLRRVPQRMLDRGLATRLIEVDTITGQTEVRAELPFWVTHVQYEPLANEIILCNSEGPGGSRGDRNFQYWGRMWSVDKAGKYSRLFEQEEDVVVNHENCVPDGSAIVYHGRRRSREVALLRRFVWAIMRRTGMHSGGALALDAHFVAARSWSGELLWTHDVPFAVKHAVSGPDGRVVAVDTADGRIVLLHEVNHDETRQDVLCLHASTMRKQDAHPHPVLTPDGAGLLFSSDVRGPVDVYEVELLSQSEE